MTGRGRAAVLAVLFGIAAWSSTPLDAQSAEKIGEWPTDGVDLASRRYAPLDQITAAKFGKLELAWRFKTESLGPRPEYNFQGTPLMVNGVVYSTGGARRAVV